MRNFLLTIFVSCVCLAFGWLIQMQILNWSHVDEVFMYYLKINVNNSLSQLSKEIEKEEVFNNFEEVSRKLLEDKKFYSNKYACEEFFEDSFVSREVRDEKNLLLLPKKEYIKETNEKIRQKRLAQLIYTREVVDEVVAQWSKEQNQKTIYDRINFESLEEKLKELLKDNGVNFPFEFNITNKNGRLIYGRAFLGEKEYSIFSHYLFSPKVYDDPYEINVAFDREVFFKDEYIRWLLPVVSVLLLLLMSFVAALVYVIYQQRLNVTRQDFVSNLTHELKTPISSISLVSQILSEKNTPKSPETIERLAKIMKDEVRRLNFQIEKVLQLSVFEKEKSLLAFKEFDIHELLREIVGNYSFKVNQLEGKLLVDLKAEQHFAMIDELHFTNAIYNLLDNATKYRKENLVIKVETWNQNEKLCIAIEDNGIGIKRQDLRHIFDRFYRAHTGNLHNVKGFGIGLSYVQKIVKKHHGNITVKSDYGIGSRFVIVIPSINN